MEARFREELRQAGTVVIEYNPVLHGQASELYEGGWVKKKRFEVPLLKNEWVEIRSPAPPCRRTHGSVSRRVWPATSLADCPRVAENSAYTPSRQLWFRAVGRSVASSAIGITILSWERRSKGSSPMGAGFARPSIRTPVASSYNAPQRDYCGTPAALP